MNNEEQRYYLKVSDEEQWLLDHGKFIQDEIYHVGNKHAMVWWSRNTRARFRSIQDNRHDAIHHMLRKVKAKLFEMSSGSYKL